MLKQSPAWTACFGRAYFEIHFLFYISYSYYKLLLDLTIRGDLERLRRNRYSFLRLNKRMGLLAIRSNITI